MAARAAWQDEERTIILQIFTGNWTWEEFYAVCDQSTRMMETVTWRVDLIADFTHTGAIPIGGAMTHAKNVVSNFPPNWGALAVVTTNQLVLLLVSTFKRVFRTTYGRRTFTVMSMDDAVNLIMKLRQLSNVPKDLDETRP